MFLIALAGSRPDREARQKFKYVLFAYVSASFLVVATPAAMISSKARFIPGTSLSLSVPATRQKCLPKMFSCLIWLKYANNLFVGQSLKLVLKISKHFVSYLSFSSDTLQSIKRQYIDKNTTLENIHTRLWIVDKSERQTRDC